MTGQIAAIDAHNAIAAGMAAAVAAAAAAAAAEAEKAVIAAAAAPPPAAEEAAAEEEPELEIDVAMPAPDMPAQEKEEAVEGKAEASMVEVVPTRLVQGTANRGITLDQFSRLAQLLHYPTRAGQHAL